MRNILFTVIILTCFACSAIAAAYSSGYSKNLKTCNPYIEKFTIKIPTDDPNSPFLNLHSTETIVGWREDKCITKSIVYSDELKQNILETKCAFSKNQVDSIVKKIEDADKGGEKASDILQKELTGYAKDTAICRVNNLIKED